MAEWLEENKVLMNRVSFWPTIKAREEENLTLNSTSPCLKRAGVSVSDAFSQQGWTSWKKLSRSSF